MYTPPRESPVRHSATIAAVYSCHVFHKKSTCTLRTSSDTYLYFMCPGPGRNDFRTTWRPAALFYHGFLSLRQRPTLTLMTAMLASSPRPRRAFDELPMPHLCSSSCGCWKKVGKVHSPSSSRVSRARGKLDGRYRRSANVLGQVMR